MNWLLVLFVVGFATAGERSTRTLGSFFGLSSSQPKQQPQQQQLQQEEVKPLVYSVKYYDNIDKVGVVPGGVERDAVQVVQPYPYVYPVVQVVPCPVEYYYTTVVDKQRQQQPVGSKQQQPQMVPGVVQPVPMSHDRPQVTYSNKPVPTQRVPVGPGGVQGQQGHMGHVHQMGIPVPVQSPQAIGYYSTTQGMVPQVNPMGMGLIPVGQTVGVVPVGQSVGVGVVPLQQSVQPYQQQGAMGVGVVPVPMGHSYGSPYGQAMYDYYPYYYNPVVAEAASSPYVYVYKPHHHHHPQQEQQQQQQQEKQQRVDTNNNNKEQGDKQKKEQV